MKRSANKLTFIAILALFHYSSCVKQIEYDFSDFNPVPAVNGILISDSIINLQISFAEKIDTSAIRFIDDAEVLLYEDDEYLETLTNIENGKYISSFSVAPLKSYRCEVLIRDYPLVTCTDSIPEASDLSIISQTNRAGFDEEGEYFGSVTFTFRDNPLIRNYYEIRLSRRIRETRRNLPLFNTTYDFLLNEGIEPASTSTLLFSDELIKEEYNTITLNYKHQSKSVRDGRQYFKAHTLYLELRTISYNYYRYMKSFYLYNENIYPKIIEGVISPFPVYSNIDNGYGIFAGYSAVIDSIHVDLEIIDY